jgi:hypothetical protein
MGPGAGDDGGHLVAFGTPEEVARSKASVTAPYLRLVLDDGATSDGQRDKDKRQGRAARDIATRP